MNQLSTKLSPPKNVSWIAPAYKIFTIGSCFSDNIGTLLSKRQFRCRVNPFGTVYNPISIVRLFKYAIDNQTITSENIQEDTGRFFHYDFHSRYNSTSRNNTLSSINDDIYTSHQELKEADIVIITLGTSFIYTKTEDQNPVSNCHKMPAKLFKKSLLPLTEIVNKINSIIELLQKENKAVKFIFTVSPVRHIKDGLIENNRSKSRLIEACHLITNDNPDIDYFPAFEIMMDELRDYRYYKDDLIHPTELAVDIIYNRFVETYFSTESKVFSEKMSKLFAAKEHKPFDAHSAKHKQFCQKQLDKISELKSHFEFVDLSEFSAHFQQYLNS